MKFSEPTWSPSDVLAYWQSTHEFLTDLQSKQFLSNEYVIAMCHHHPENIREAISKYKKVNRALAHIYALEDYNEEKNRRIYDQSLPSWSEGITNPHLSDKLVDPFDLGDDYRKFTCSKCNLRYSQSMQSEISDEICKSCAFEEV